MDMSVFWPRALLNQFWKRIRGHLTANGEHSAVEYLFSNTVFEDESGMLWAPWACPSFEILPGFTAYLNNALESFWRQLA